MVPLFRIAVVIPARNEAGVISQKMANTHAMRFPGILPGRPHLAVVVDDHSQDGTIEVAQAYAAQLPARRDLEWRMVKNTATAGKGGALRTAFREAAGCDLIILTDADALVTPNAPVATAAAMMNPRMGAATGRQQYVASLQGGVPSGPCGDVYDAISEFVRAVESRFGALFSVHGPWLALRAAAGAEPREGVAADDLDLLLQIRKRGWRSVLLRDVLFFEWKPSGPSLSAQRERRARAYFELLDRHWNGALRLWPVPAGFIQFVAYACGPVLAGLAVFAAAAAPTVAVFVSTRSPALALSCALATASICNLSWARNLLHYAAVILRARFARPRDAADRWEPTARPA
jgi:cellulose synthase/poly-beta-1,6-N-acetylglucosamine synthase-like glycosyltransferase